MTFVPRPIASRSDLLAAIDDAFEAAHRAHPEALACRAGCADCCVAGLPVTDVEAAAITAFVEALDEGARAALAARVARVEEASCVLLDDDAACSIYPARPVVCRTFGLPHRLAYEEARAARPRRLPVFGVVPTGRVVGTCFKNFVRPDVADAHPDCVVDQASLGAVLARVGEHGARTPVDEAPRLAALVRRLLGVPEPVGEGAHEPPAP